MTIMCESMDTQKNIQGEKTPTENRQEKGRFKVFCQNSHLINTLYVKTLLAQKGIEVLTNTDMEKAHALIRDYQPHLVLSDILDKPDGMTGYDLCRQHKACAVTNHIPFCFLTSLTGSADRQRALEAGAQCYLNLPMDKEALVKAVMQLLE